MSAVLAALNVALAHAEGRVDCTAEERAAELEGCRIALEDALAATETKVAACGKSYTDRNGDPDICSFPPNHDGSCW